MYASRTSGSDRLSPPLRLFAEGAGLLSGRHAREGRNASRAYKGTRDAYTTKAGLARSQININGKPNGKLIWLSEKLPRGVGGRALWL